ncbi:MAG: protein kinase [Planctomycetes bacterium]|nr:protein kinase [Planctomycetota bacterium]
MTKNRQQIEDACPDEAVLQGHLNERLDESRDELIGQHVGTCARCQAKLETIAAAPDFWGELRSIDVSEVPTDRGADGPAPYDVQALLERVVRLLHPTDDPRMLGRIGHYEVCGLIGHGTTGVVLKAFEPRLARYVAIKLMSPDYRDSASARRRFAREARAIAAVMHENVVEVHAVDTHGDLPYFVMNYVAGASLEDRIARHGALETCEVVRIGLQVARGLAAAHSQGIVHRDVKPANVILEPSVERAVVTDFGLARVNDEASLTLSGTIAGTPHYMSPEQARGDLVDARSDLFSLGSLMYAAATGRPPFRAETVFGVLNRVAEHEPRAIRDIEPRVDEWLAAFIRKLIAKKPEERFQSAEEVATLLSAELAHLQNPVSIAAPPRDWMSRAAAFPSGWRRRIAWIAGCAAVLGFTLWAQGESDSAKRVRRAIASLLPFSVQDPSGAWTRRVVERDGVGHAVYEQTLERTRSCADVGAVRMRLSGAHVELASSSTPSLRVIARRSVEAETEREATERVAGLFTFGIDSAGGGITIEAVRSDRMDLESSGNATATYHVEVPDGMKLELDARDATLSIGDIDGETKISLSGGHLELADVGGTLDVRATDADVTAISGMRAKADFFVMHGRVRVGDARGTVWINTSDGNIELLESSGKVSAQASGGNIEIHGIRGATKVHAEGGDVRAELFDEPLENSSLSSAGGHIEVALDEGADVHCVVDGSLKSELPFERVSPTRHELVRGDGSKRLSCITTTGDVRVAVHARGDADPAHDGRTVPVRESSGRGLGGSRSGVSGLGGSGNGRSGHGGSGLGGSGHQSDADTRAARGIQALATEARRGGLSVVEFPEPIGNVDGYVLYLPTRYRAATVDRGATTFPLIVYLQGSFGVGGAVSDVVNWGMPRLLRDAQDATDARYRRLLDDFVVVCVHISEGRYGQTPSAIERILTEVTQKYAVDPKRISVTGLSRGGHGTWELAAKLPGHFAAIAPIGASPGAVDDWSRLANTSVWIAHNESDQVAEFDEALAASNRLEHEFGVKFLRIHPRAIDGVTPVNARFENVRYVFSSSPTGNHDAWTDLYTSAGFYAWLAAQARQE